jgi:hypothetical protein
MLPTCNVRKKFENAAGRRYLPLRAFTASLCFGVNFAALSMTKAAG